MARLRVTLDRQIPGLGKGLRAGRADKAVPCPVDDQHRDTFRQGRRGPKTHGSQ